MQNDNRLNGLSRKHDSIKKTRRKKSNHELLEFDELKNMWERSPDLDIISTSGDVSYNDKFD